MSERPAPAWIFGALMGALVVYSPYVSGRVGGIDMLAFPIAIAVALLLVFASRQPAMGGGLLLTIGVWMSYTHFAMLRRCAQMNSPTGSCTVVDAGGTAYPAIAFVIAGVVLSIYPLGKRSLRGGE